MMKIIIKNIMAILNINVKEAEQGAIIAYRIEEKLNSLNSKYYDSFIKYCEANFNSVELKYLTGYQKFLTLFKKFIDGYVLKNKEKYKNENEKRIYELVNKVAKVKPAHEQAIIRGVKLDYSHLRNSKTKEPFFSKDEIEKLSLISKDIGGVLWQIEAFGIDSVVDNILNILAKKITNNTRKLLLNNTKHSQISLNSNEDIPKYSNSIKMPEIKRF